jgi:hypothetical protein
MSERIYILKNQLFFLVFYFKNLNVFRGEFKANCKKMVEDFYIFSVLSYGPFQYQSPKK